MTAANGGLIVNQSSTQLGSGTINLTGNGATLQLDDSQAINSGTLNIGNNANAGVTLIQQDVNGTGGTLNLGANLAINQTGKNATITTGGSNGSGDSIVIGGNVTAGISGGDLTISPDDLTTEGAITVSNGDELDLVADDDFLNTASGNISVTGSKSTLFLGADTSFSNLGSIQWLVWVPFSICRAPS